MMQGAMLTMSVALVLLPIAMAATLPLELESALSLPFNVTLGGDSPYTRLSAVRTDYDDVTKCITKQGCAALTCPECYGQADYCAYKCQLNCICGCDGLPGSSPNYDNAFLSSSCILRKNCGPTFSGCQSVCSNNECMVTCFMSFLQCVCPCNQLAVPSSAPPPNSTPASTAASTPGSTPASTPPEPSAAASARPASLVGVLAALCAAALASRR